MKTYMHKEDKIDMKREKSQSIQEGRLLYQQPEWKGL
jgi:hypothetical protein